MSLTQFYDRTSDRDGPVSGAVQLIPVVFDTALTSATHTRRVDFPAGMKFKVTDVVIYSGTIVGTPIVSIGTTAAGTQIVKQTLSASATARTVALTVKSYTEAATGTVNVQILCGSGETVALPLTVNVVGHVSGPPTSMAIR